MLKVVGVRFKTAGKIYYFSPGSLDLAAEDFVIVETVRGVEMGQIAFGVREICEQRIAAFQPLKEIKRKASAADHEHQQILRQKEREAYLVCLEKIKQHDLGMKLLDAEYTFDAAKLIFQFTAEGRIDFRELVRDLASVFRTRIELRQVGVRDEAKLIGGIGGCGRELCCCSFLGDFHPVSIKMARDQNLSLNPTKISGVCGRLLCCLNYELEDYNSANQTVGIEMGSIVDCDAGRGKVIYLNNRRNIARVKNLASGEIVEFPLNELLLVAEEDPDLVSASEENSTGETPFVSEP